MGFRSDDRKESTRFYWQIVHTAAQKQMLQHSPAGVAVAVSSSILQHKVRVRVKRNIILLCVCHCGPASVRPASWHWWLWTILLHIVCTLYKLVADKSTQPSNSLRHVVPDQPVNDQAELFSVRACVCLFHSSEAGKWWNFRDRRVALERHPGVARLAYDQNEYNFRPFCDILRMCNAHKTHASRNQHTNCKHSSMCPLSLADE